MSQFVKFARALAKDEAGVVTMEWAVAASILAIAGIAAFLAIGGEVKGLLTEVQGQLEGTANSAGLPGTATQ